MGGKVERFVVPAVIGFAPFMLMLLTWGPGGRTEREALVLSYYLPIVGVELFVIAIAVREGIIGAMRHWSWPRVPTAALLLLIVIANVTALLAPSPGIAQVATAYWLIHLLFGFSVAHLCGRQFGASDLAAAYLIGFAVFLGGAILFATEVTDPNFNWTNGWPAAAHIRHLGYYVAAMIALGIGLASGTSDRRLLGALFILCVVGFGFALWTGSRGTLVGVGGAMLLSLLLIPRVRRPLVWGGAGISLALGAAIATLFPSPAVNMGFGRTVAATVDHEVTTGRTVMWRGALEAIERRPLFGYGAGQMGTVAPFYGLAQPHDVVLQVLLAWGAAGLVCVLILAWWFLRRSLPAVNRESGNSTPALMAMFALASFALIDGALYHVVPLSIFAGCAGMVAAGWRVESAKR